MPLRTPEHIVASKAVTAVCAVWNAIDAAADEIRNDYGEDLLIQTCIEGAVDASRIWVQVKGRTSPPILRRGGQIRALRVSWDHAVRWANSADMMVLVVWDVTSGRGWYAFPRDQVDPFELLSSGRRSIQIVFDDRDVFDVRAAHLIAWQARIEHAAGQIVSARAGIWEHNTITGRAAAAQHQANRISFISWDLLCKIGVFGPDELLPSFVATVKQACLNIRQKEPLWERTRVFDHAVMLGVLGHFDKAADCGLPLLVMEALADAAASAIMAEHQGLPEWVPPPT